MPTPPKDQSAKPRLKEGSPVCQCTICNLFFSAPSAFDKHLIGLSDKCRSPHQMRAIGMVQNEHGVWLVGISRKALREMEQTA